LNAKSKGLRRTSVKLLARTRQLRNLALSRRMAQILRGSKRAKSGRAKPAA
jgi:hypothetical protein